jgi:hypothetical protein
MMLAVTQFGFPEKCLASTLQPTLDPHSSSQAVQGFDDGAICVFSVAVDSFQLLGKLMLKG